MKTIIRKYKLNTVWHFTDRSNLESIERHEGLLSLRELERRGIEIPVPGGNDWSHEADRTNGLDAYVHLAFVNDHPMLFSAGREKRINDPIWIKIDATIMLQSDVRFCADVSNKSGVELLDAEEAKTEIDFEVLYMYMNWTDPEIQKRRQEAIKSEILIPKIVPIDKILGCTNG